MGKGVVIVCNCSSYMALLMEVEYAEDGDYDGRRYKGVIGGGGGV